MSENHISLAQAHEGDVVRILGLNSQGAMRRRLQDIGFITGASVERLQSGPAGDPTAFYIKGTVIALRREDSSEIIVEKA